MSIVNIKSKKPYDIYIGRVNKAYGVKDSIFRNPYVIGVDGTRAEVIKKFEHYAPTNPLIQENLYLLDDMVIGCWCDYPKEDCHGRVLLEMRELQKKHNL